MMNAFPKSLAALVICFLSLQSPIFAAQSNEKSDTPVTAGSGNDLYNQIYDNLLNNSLALRNPKAKQAWAKKWQNPGPLRNSQETTAAINNMVASLNEKYTAYLDPKQKQALDKRWQAIQPVTMNSVDSQILYIKLSHFQNEKIVNSMATCLLTAKKYGYAVLLDLRDNPGGNFQSGLAIASQMIPTGLLVKTKKRVDGHIVNSSIVLAENAQVEESSDKYPDLPFHAQVQPRTALVLPGETPIVALVNERTASAAELLAGALKFSGRATLVGVKTFGKGVGMSNVNIAENQILQTTSFEFFPAGKNINGIGVSPQVTVPNGSHGDSQFYEAVQMLKKAIKEKSI